MAEDVVVDPSVNPVEYGRFFVLGNKATLGYSASYIKDLLRECGCSQLSFSMDRCSSVITSKEDLSLNKHARIPPKVYFASDIVPKMELYVTLKNATGGARDASYAVLMAQRRPRDNIFALLPNDVIRIIVRLVLASKKDRKLWRVADLVATQRQLQPTAAAEPVSKRTKRK